MNLIWKTFAVAISLCFMAGPAYASDVPTKFKKCKACHGVPGEGKKKMGPDLATSEMNLEQFTNMVIIGSKWEGRPERMAKYAKKKMRPVKKLTEEEIKAIFDYAQAAK